MRSVIALVTITCVGIANAVDAAPAPSPFLEEIIVTAEKVKAPVRDTSIALTAIDKRIIKDFGMTGPEDIQMFVPSYSRSVYDVTLRGIGRNFRSLGGDPGVASYFNGVYSENVAIGATEDRLYDLQRIEVLRGPQGTLYGRNAVGGVVNYITNPPTDVPTGELMARFDGHGAQEFYGVLSGTLVPDRVLGRLVAMNADTGNDRQSKAVPGQRPVSDTGQLLDRNIALSLEIMPTDNIDVLIRANDRRNDVDQRASLVIGEGEGNRRNRSSAVCYPVGVDCYVEPVAMGINGPALNGAAYQMLPVSGDGFGRNLDGQAYLDFKPRSAVDTSAVTMDAQWRFGYDRFTLRYVAGYTDVDFRLNADLGASGGRNTCLPPTCAQGPGGQGIRENHFAVSEEYHLYSHDLQLITNLDGRWNFVGGLFRYHARTTQVNDYHEPQHLGTYTVDPSYGLFGDDFLGPPTFPGKHNNGVNGPATISSWGGDADGTYFWSFNDTVVDAYAVYGQATYDLNAQFRLTLGARWSKDEKQGYERRWGYFEPDPAAFGLDLPTINFLLTTDPSTGEYNGDPLRLVGVPISFQDGVDIEDEWDEPTWRVNLDYRPDDRTLAYASATTGYRSGGFNLSLNQQFSFDAETVISYEFGLKKLMLNDRLQLNAAAYLYDYENHQVRAFQPVRAAEFGCVPGDCPDDPDAIRVIDAVRNVPKSRNWGIELEGLLSVTTQLTLGGLYSYMRTEITDDFFVSEAGNPFATTFGTETVNVKGNELNRAPRHVFTAWVNYSLPMGEYGTLGALTAYSYMDEQYWDVLNGRINQSPSFYRLDTRLNWDSPRQRYRVSAFVKNMTDELGIVDMRGGPNLQRVADTTLPRVWGIEVRVRFGDWSADTTVHAIDRGNLL